MGSLESLGRNGPAGVLCAAEMRALEAAAFADGRVTSAEAMAHAGEAVAEACRGQTAAGRALVLCGPGNNGGDGYVAACSLARSGWRVTVLGLGDPARMGPDATAARAEWLTLGPIGDLLADAPLPTVDVVLDAVFGIGLTRGVEGALADSFARITGHAALCGAEVIAADVPSGVDSDTGEATGAVLVAARTVTFHALKPVHLRRPDLCGQVSVVEIGL